jgi:nicotinate-nucleotide adenylyltransferase
VKPNAPLGILGGTFDPIHYGHLRLAQELAVRLDLDGVRFIPAGTPPHRGSPRVAPGHRLEMARLAIAGNPLFALDAREAFKPTPCYTVETLTELRRELGPDRSLCLLMGADAFLGLTEWHRWRELFGLAHIAVAERPGFAGIARAAVPAPLKEELGRRLRADATALRDTPAGAVVTCGVTALDISATRIRQGLQAGESPRYLLPDAVLDYIGSHRLYGAPEPTGRQN